MNTLHLRELVIATGNEKKLLELRALIGASGLRLRSQAEFDIAGADETGLSFVENAILKARHASHHSGLPALADDSGLEVDALNGRPGIYSSRFAGPQASDEQNNRKLLDALADIPDQQRGARFHCVIALMRHAEDPVPLICSGTWEGMILRGAAGEGGFGYDPLFLVPEYGCSAAELPAGVKNHLSHRALALAQLLAALGIAC
ncbi:MAG: RdgB/HAM1 family non-canonical purine NTP pyrophosphatase [Pseudomonadales bacterium]|nr:RdgB/HAM1 family non-canonical purine NTP pyrophosphatase [Pseudomonadales bacterium]